MPYPVVPPALPPVAADVSAAPLQMTSVEAIPDRFLAVQVGQQHLDEGHALLAPHDDER
ncbi:MAG: hypothetical protein F6K04_18820, partial [Leptolyngbya sp. SIO4C5]|nr:hypothetical protein [Leptolyngbya sp. SIO4C5]